MRILPLARWLVLTVLSGASLFLPAGSWNLPTFWMYLTLYSASNLATAMVSDPDLIKERLLPRVGGKDHLLRILALPILMAQWIMAGLDVGRFHWSDRFPPEVQIIGLLGAGLWVGLVCWAMAANRFFSSVTRLQPERGHHPITHGPYRFVRHPGYLGMIIGYGTTGVALGSWFSVLPGLLGTLLVIRRTALEDRFLLESLDGYASYASKVRYRLVPALW